MKNKLLTTAILLTAITAVYGCGGSCQCYKYQGCAVLTVKKKTGFRGSDTVLRVQRYCARTGIDFYVDPALRDSVLAFQKNHFTDTSYVVRLDSVYEADRVMRIKYGGTDTYERNGYNCSCAK